MESHGGARAHDAALCGCRTVRGERRGVSSVILASGGILPCWLVAAVQFWVSGGCSSGRTCRPNRRGNASMNAALKKTSSDL